MLQRFTVVGLMGVVLSMTACDRTAQLKHLQESYSPPRTPSQRLSPTADNAIKDSVIPDPTIKAATEDATAETGHNPRSSSISSSSSLLDEEWLPEFQDVPSAQIKADLKEQARRVKQTP